MFMHSDLKCLQVCINDAVAGSVSISTTFAATSIGRDAKLKLDWLLATGQGVAVNSVTGTSGEVSCKIMEISRMC